MAALSVLKGQRVTSATHVVIRQPLVCASCGGTFYDRHECPTIPSQTCPAPRVYVHISTITVQCLRGSEE
jgi:hypothetical protein